MKLVFVDEAGDAKFKYYLGICVAVVDARFYALLKAAAQSILKHAGWDRTVEFKGTHLFSASKGCPRVDIPARIKAAGELLDLNVATSNSRMRFHYGRVQTPDHGGAYRLGLPPLLAKALGRAPRGAGKNLLSVVCDERSDVPSQELHDAIATVVSRSGYVLHETVVCARSSFDSVGLMFADIVGYLAARIDTVTSDADLFEGLTEEQFRNNGKIRKLKTSLELIKKVKALTLYVPTTVNPSNGMQRQEPRVAADRHSVPDKE